MGMQCLGPSVQRFQGRLSYQPMAQAHQDGAENDKACYQEDPHQ